MLIENDGQGVIPTPEPQVSAFLNQPSPVKTYLKRSFTDLVGNGNKVLAFDINNVDNFDNDNVGCIDRSSDNKEEIDDNESKAAGKAVKKEKIHKAKKQSSKGPTRVSKRKRKLKRR